MSFADEDKKNSSVSISFFLLIDAGTSCAVWNIFFLPCETVHQPAGLWRFPILCRFHFRADNEAALKMGAEPGRYAVETWMKK